jgi:4-amino-4-deoxy-L-arabinose transferase-like glycosyltransferase
LVFVADLARLLPRHWDGQRLMRFLAGLAVVALGFLTAAVPAVAAPAVPAVAAPAAAVVAEASPAVQLTAAESTKEVRAADKVEPCWHGGHVATAAIDTGTGMPVGATQAAYGSRGPPAARV